MQEDTNMGSEEMLCSGVESISRAANFNMHNISLINCLPRMPFGLSFDDSTFSQHDNVFSSVYKGY